MLLLPFQVTAGDLVSSDPGLGAGEHSPCVGEPVQLNEIDTITKHITDPGLFAKERGKS